MSKIAPDDLVAVMIVSAFSLIVLTVLGVPPLDIVFLFIATAALLVGAGIFCMGLAMLRNSRK